MLWYVHTFPDLAHGFGVIWFYGSTTRLDVSSRSIFGGRGVAVKCIINFNILFGMLAERRKNIYMSDLAHGFDVTLSKL